MVAIHLQGKYHPPLNISVRKIDKMNFDFPLLSGTLIKRYKRFMADIHLDDGTEVTAHCANSGAMLGLTTPGTPVWVSPKPYSKGVLKYAWELARLEGTWVGVNTSHPNKIVTESIEKGHIPELTGYTSLRREVKYGTNSRIDILLSDPAKPRCYVEVKNVHLLRNTLAEFPDSVTARGKKHLEELSHIVKNGERAVMVYIIQRNDAKGFKIAEDIDPAYFEAYLKAKEAGVEMVAYGCNVTPNFINLTHKLELKC